MERIEILKSYLSENPDDNFLQHALALEYMKTGADEKAIALFEALLQRDESYVGSYYQLGKLLEKQQDNERAVAVYKKGIEMATRAGETRAAGELRSALEQLEDDF